MSLAIGVPVEPGHVDEVAARMRRADRDEVMASHAMDPKAALVDAIGCSVFSRTLLIGGEPAAIFGVQQLDEHHFVPWALTTDVVDRHPLAFWKASKHVVSELQQRFPVLVQFIDARHQKALRWVKRLGFVVDDSPVWRFAYLRRD